VKIKKSGAGTINFKPCCRVKESSVDAISWYQNHIEEVIERYESLRFEDIHNHLLNRLPDKHYAYWISVREQGVMPLG